MNDSARIIKACNNCKYSVKVPQVKGSLLTCNRHAPSIDAHGFARWPMVRDDWRCGDHRYFAASDVE